MGITGMNHAVLYVRDARRTAEFYRSVLDFTTVIEDAGGGFVFLRGPDSANPARASVQARNCLLSDRPCRAYDEPIAGP